MFGIPQHPTIISQPQPLRRRRIYEFLRAHPVAVLSTVTPDGDPHGVVIYLTLNEQFLVKFLTRKRTRKYDNLVHNRRAMLTVFAADTQTSVQITGTADEITSSREINRIAAGILGASIKTSSAALPPVTKLEAGEYAAFRVNPLQIRMAVYSAHDPGDYQDIFDSIESFDVEADPD